LARPPILGASQKRLPCPAFALNEHSDLARRAEACFKVTANVRTAEVTVI